MNPTAGSFTIDTRLQRHFAVFAVSFPGMESLETIYIGILSQHLADGFQQQVQKYASSLIRGALELHRRIATSFLPTAIKFHYIFNLRDLSNIFQVRSRDLLDRKAFFLHSSRPFSSLNRRRSKRTTISFVCTCMNLNVSIATNWWIEQTSICS